MTDSGEFVAKYAVGKVVELGCGKVPLAKWIEGEYVGVDSSEAILQHVSRSGVAFVQADPLDYILSKPPGAFDTIILSKLIQRVEDPPRLVEAAITRAKERVIATIPLDCKGEIWTKPDLVELFGEMAVCQIYQGHHWLVVKTDAKLPITVFAHPKPWKGLDAVQQTNALKSWGLLEPTPEILLLGDNEGTQVMAKKFGLHHIPEKELGPFKLPFVKNFFYDGQKHASHDHMLYVNSDIIPDQKIVEAIWHAAQLFEQYLIIGQRFDTTMNEPLSFSEGWQEELAWRTRAQGKLHNSSGMDYFAFVRGLYKAIPDFIIARCAWDNWLVWSALSQGVPVIDATKFTLAVHQEHDRGARGSSGWRAGYRYNVEQAAGHLCAAPHATWILDGLGLRPVGDSSAPMWRQSG